MNDASERVFFKIMVWGCEQDASTTVPVRMSARMTGVSEAARMLVFVPRPLPPNVPLI